MEAINLQSSIVQEWTKGCDIVADASNQFGELFVVAKDSSGAYLYLRFFTVNGQTQVSCDMHGHLEMVVKTLLNRAAKY